MRWLSNADWNEAQRREERRQLRALIRGMDSYMGRRP